jgi:hypothetical protein
VRCFLSGAVGLGRKSIGCVSLLTLGMVRAVVVAVVCWHACMHGMNGMAHAMPMQHACDMSWVSCVWCVTLAA